MPTTRGKAPKPQHQRLRIAMELREPPENAHTQRNTSSRRCTLQQGSARTYECSRSKGTLRVSHDSQRPHV
ncbi:hypothetical protein PWT90_11226 [Aphanocladium album]|nr:hypothetical protein PWT90_11226 [Aphanocladium album]